MAAIRNLLELPSDLPLPLDDGGARHLTGVKLPDLALPATMAHRSTSRGSKAARSSTF